MTSRKLTIRLALALIPVLFLGAGYVINNPAEDGQELRTENLSCLGSTEMGQSVLLKLWVDGDYKGNYTIMIPPMGVSWSYEWPRLIDPGTGITLYWKLGANNRLELWAGDPYGKQDSNAFEFVDL